MSIFPWNTKENVAKFKMNYHKDLKVYLNGELIPGLPKGPWGDGYPYDIKVKPGDKITIGHKEEDSIERCFSFNNKNNENYFLGRGKVTFTVPEDVKGIGSVFLMCGTHMADHDNHIDSFRFDYIVDDKNWVKNLDFEFEEKETKKVHTYKNKNGLYKEKEEQKKQYFGTLPSGYDMMTSLITNDDIEEDEEEDYEH